MNIRRVFVASVIASVVMGMIEMVYEGVAGAGFWSPLTFIGATVLRNLQTVPVPVSFDLPGVVLGLIGHMMNSLIFGIILGWIILKASLSRTGLVSTGVAYALGIFLVMWYIVIPGIDPVMLKLNGTVFAISHLMWGAALGLIMAPYGDRAGSLRTALTN